MRSAPEKICNAMLILLQSKSITEITVKELIAQAGVSRSSYNYNFYSVNEVIDRIISDITQGIINVMDSAYRSGEKLSDNNGNLYSQVFTYIYSRREQLRVLDNSGFHNQITNKLTADLTDFLGRWSYVYTNAEGEEELLSDGMVYNLKNTENASRIVADFTFWAQYDYSLPADFYTDIIRSSRKIRMTRAEPKKIIS